MYGIPIVTEQIIMLLQNDSLDVVNNHGMPAAQSVNCIARLDQDVGCAIPYGDNDRKCIRSRISLDANVTSSLDRSLTALGRNEKAGKLVTMCDHLHGIRDKISQSRVQW